ncbi:uncharacterized protein LOC123988291 [Osmia bicornis bicornis]|uniref:uncharacterized protein LOC123988291 n=1 Tax=Osmia bicornis bicornis TaxID=1437191 RepID=UPI001EAF5023|nr:uncharacterized protein LOC123988291 [Osmia bicornis bicornis]
MEHHRTTAYHPQSNGMVERFHRQLKAAISCHGDGSWTEALPSVLLGIRATIKEDAQTAEMVYGETLRLPGDLIEGDGQQEVSRFIEQLRRHMRALKPVKTGSHGKKAVFVFKDLASADQVFVRRDMVKKPLQPPYDGPYPVVRREAKTFTIRIGESDAKVSIDRLKPAFILSTINCSDKETKELTKEKKTVHFST